MPTPAEHLTAAEENLTLASQDSGHLLYHARVARVHALLATGSGAGAHYDAALAALDQAETIKHANAALNIGLERALAHATLTH